jgi:hypothetical protein
VELALGLLDRPRMISSFGVELIVRADLRAFRPQ